MLVGGIGNDVAVRRRQLAERAVDGVKNQRAEVECRNGNISVPQLEDTADAVVAVVVFIWYRLHVSGYAGRSVPEPCHACCYGGHPYAPATVGKNVEQVVGVEQWRLIV